MYEGAVMFLIGTPLIGFTIEFKYIVYCDCEVCCMSEQCLRALTAVWFPSFGSIVWIRWVVSLMYDGRKITTCFSH